MSTKRPKFWEVLLAPEVQPFGCMLIFIGGLLIVFVMALVKELIL